MRKKYPKRLHLRAEIWDIIHTTLSCGLSHEDSADKASVLIVKKVQNNYRRRIK